MSPAVAVKITRNTCLLLPWQITSGLARRKPLLRNSNRNILNCVMCVEKEELKVFNLFVFSLSLRLGREVASDGVCLAVVACNVGLNLLGNICKAWDDRRPRPSSAKSSSFSVNVWRMMMYAISSCVHLPLIILWVYKEVFDNEMRVWVWVTNLRPYISATADWMAAKWAQSAGKSGRKARWEPFGA